MNSTLFDTEQSNTQPVAFDQAVVATYRSHTDAEAAVRLLASGGLAITHISIIGRHFETHEDVQGFYRPADAALAGLTALTMGIGQENAAVIKPALIPPSVLDRLAPTNGVGPAVGAEV